MSLLVDYPIPVENTEYVYFLGELMEFEIGIYLWMQLEGKYLIRKDQIERKYPYNNIWMRLRDVMDRKRQLKMEVHEKTDKEILETLVSILEH